MRISLTGPFQRQIKALTVDQRGLLFDVLLALPAAFGDPAKHSGLGLRKIHRSGVWEARLGLGLRLVLLLGPDEIVLVRVGNHDDVRRYLRSL